MCPARWNYSLEILSLSPIHRHVHNTRGHIFADTDPRRAIIRIVRAFGLAGQKYCRR